MAQNNFTVVGNNTWTCPANVSTINVTIFAAGGGGGGGNATRAGGGGGGGAVALLTNYVVTINTNYSLTVGTGGANGGIKDSKKWVPVSAVTQQNIPKLMELVKKMIEPPPQQIKEIPRKQDLTKFYEQDDD